VPKTDLKIVILRPLAVILSGAKDLALSIFKAMRDSSSPLLFRMKVLSSFSAACKAPSFRPASNSVTHFSNLALGPGLESPPNQEFPFRESHHLSGFGLKHAKTDCNDKAGQFRFRGAIGGFRIGLYVT
jgi:hypothetical protein